MGGQLLRGLSAVLAVALLPLLLITAVIADVDMMLSSLLQRGGSVADFRAWRLLIENSRNLEAQDKLKRINEFFNRKIQSAEDDQVWGQTDYWATPFETLAKGKGDCEDFSIAKYFTLLEAGMPNEQLRLIYVKARIGGPSSSISQAHMVLAYYRTPEDEPQILDNLITDIRSASRRPDLLPVFSFNSLGIWAGTSASYMPGGTSAGRLTRWQDLLTRVRREGFEY